MLSKPAKSRTRPQWLLAVSASIALWCGLIYAAATIPKSIDPFNIPSLCGAWGCTAKTNDLVAYHLVWLATTVPLAGWLAAKYRSTRIAAVGRWTMVGVAVGTLLTVVLAAIYWRYTNGSPSEPWPWRYGLYLMFGNADIPIAPTFFCGLAASLLGRPRTTASLSETASVTQHASTPST